MQFLLWLLLLSTPTAEELNQKSWSQLSHSPDSALSTAIQAAERAETEKNWNELGKAYVRIAYFYRYKGNKDSCIHYFEKSLVQRRRAQNVEGEIATLQNLASFYRASGDYLLASNAVHQYLKRAKQIDNLESVAFAHGQLGIIHNRLDEQEDALADLRKAKNIFLKIGQANKAAGQMDQMVEVFGSIGQTDSAQHFFDKSAETRTEALNPTEEVSLATRAGNLQFHQNNYEAAIAHYQSALDKAETIQRQDLKGGLLNNIGSCYENQGMLERALTYFKEADQVFEKIGTQDARLHSLNNLATTYEQLNQKALAYDALAMANQLKDALNSIEKQRAIKEMEILHEVEIKEAENETLSAKNRRKNLGLLALATSFLLLSLVAFFALRYFRKRSLLAKKELESFIAEQELQSVTAMLDGQERERKRIAKDLHDRLGALLSTVKLHFSGIESELNYLKQEQAIQYAKALGLLDESVREVRRISHAMEAGTLSQGLELALSDLKEQLESTNQVKMELLCQNVDDRLNHRQRTQLFRIIQELVTNSLRHGKAKNISIQFNIRDKILNLLVEDDGKGFKPKEREEGLGTKSIKHRVKQMNGSFHIDSQPNKGVTAIIDIPLNLAND